MSLMLPLNFTHFNVSFQNNGPYFFFFNLIVENEIIRNKFIIIYLFNLSIT